jgi:serine/threonine protein kinase/Tfp pilus assembly protein PilF
MPDSSDERNPVEVLFEEFMARKRRGEKPTLSEYSAQHPDLADDIRELFPALMVMEDIGESSMAATGPANVESEPPYVPDRLGDYRILRRVGHGGMGYVYEAEQESLGCRRALKIMKPQFLNNPKHVRRFEREARAAAKLHHTNIVPVFGVGCDQGLHYYVMQFIQGKGLDEVLEELKQFRKASPKQPLMLVRGGKRPELNDGLHPAAGALGSPEPNAPRRPMSEIAQSLAAGASAPTMPDVQTHSSDLSVNRDQAQSQLSTASEWNAGYWRSVARIGVQVAEALDYAHSQGILHRDIKPSNLLLDLRGTVWVTDFGLAKVGDADNLTHTGDIVGTFRYMAPERFSGQSDARADVYALGVTLYELLALRPAFTECDRAKLMREVLHDDPTPLRRVNPAIPRDLARIVHKATAKELAERYQSPQSLAEALKAFIEDRPSPDRRVRPWERALKWARRRPAAAALVALSVAVVLGVFASVLAVSAKFRATATELQAALDERELADRRREISDAYAKAVDWIESKDLDKAISLLESTLESTPDDPRLEEDLTKLKALLRDYDTELLQEAKQKYDEFRHLHEEALFRATFPLSRDTGAEMLAARMAAKKALHMFGWEPGQEWRLGKPYDQYKKEIQTSCYELVYILADIAAQPAGEPGLAGPPPNPGEPQALLALLKGYSLLRKGKLEEAIEALNEALNERPNYFWAHYMQALCHFRAQRMRVALICLDNCLRAESQPSPLVYLVRGVVLARLEKFSKAEDDFQSGLDQKPEKWIEYGLYNNRGVTWLRRHDLTRAMEDFRQAVTVYPNPVEAYVNLSEAFEDLASLAGTPKFVIALLAAPSGPAVCPTLACPLQDRIYWLHRAGEQLKKASDVASKDASIFVRRARIHRECGEMTEAMETINQAVGLKDAELESAIYAERGLILSHRAKNLEEYADALADFDRALKDPKADVRIHVWKANTLSQMANAESNPKKRPGYFRQAEAALEPYLNSVKVRKAEAFDVYRFRGMLRLKLERYSAAISDLTVALEAGDDSELLTERGWAHWAVYEAEAARHDFLKALELNPRYGRAHNGLGLALLWKSNPSRTEEVREAIRHAESALACGPQTALLLYDAARIYAQASARIAAEGPKAKGEALRYESQAVRCLEQALPLGISPTLGDKIKTDDLLAPLRNRPDFERLKSRLPLTPELRPKR